MMTHFAAHDPLVGVYGPPDSGVRVVQAFDALDVEYAAIRRACGLMDLPQRATLEVRGGERLDFLNRMLTQELKGARPWSCRRAFWLSRSGRIDGDVRVLVLEDRVLLDVDVHAAEKVRQTLSAYVIAEDVDVVDRTEEFHRIALQGPGARAALERCGEHVSGAAVGGLEPGQACRVRVGGVEVTADRDDTAGEIGLELLVEARHAAAVYEELLRAGGWQWGRERRGGEAMPLARPIGWGAYNVARVEAGTPWYFLDFGPTNLPHESGVLESRVSFTKGCYLGQEIVARMQNLGQPKQRLVGLRLPGAPVPSKPEPQRTELDATEAFDPPIVPQPVTGAAVFLADSAEAAEPVGSVCSSAISPMLGGVPVCFAMLKSKHALPGAGVRVECEGTMLPATVQPGLAFWQRAGAR